MKKEIEQTALKRSIHGQQMHEEMFNILHENGKASQKCTEIPSQPSQNNNHQEN
jgi:hypothetical protein